MKKTVADKPAVKAGAVVAKPETPPVDITADEVGIFEIISAALEGQVTYSGKPERGVVDTGYQTGIITSEVTRNLWAANAAMVVHISEETERHLRMHMGQAVDLMMGRSGVRVPGGADGLKRDCGEFHRSVNRKKEISNVLSFLTMKAITTQMPVLMAFDKIAISEGWLASGIMESEEPLVEALGGPETFDPDLANLGPDGYVVTAFINELRKVVSCTEAADGADASNANTRPFDKERESVIGIVTDPRVKSTRVLADRLEAILKFVSSLPDTKTAGDMSIARLYSTKVWAEHIQALYGLTRSILWRGIRDTMLEARDVEHLGLREGWKVVEVRKSADPELSPILQLSQLPPELRRVLEGLGL